MPQNANDQMRAASRSRIMSAIRKKDTKAELVVRRLLHVMGYRFRLHRRDLPGCPDVVLPRHRAVVMVHGCFWHRHANCRHANLPRSRTEYWLPKLARNVERDKRSIAALEALGWRVLVVWECELGNLASLRDRLSTFLRDKPA
jgi:DNA mismatch endonuclease (patch repair protein)